MVRQAVFTATEEEKEGTGFEKTKKGGEGWRQ